MSTTAKTILESIPAVIMAGGLVFIALAAWATRMPASRKIRKSRKAERKRNAR